jgi:peptidoglycan/LPS O-acetylase OafA/YrhL
MIGRPPHSVSPVRCSMLCQNPRYLLRCTRPDLSTRQHQLRENIYRCPYSIFSSQRSIMTTTQTTSQPQTDHPALSMEKHSRHLVRGLDTIRCLCAVWVMMSHCGPPPLVAGIDKSHYLGYIISGIYDNLWSGAAAVIVFFVISGFCIHYPQAHRAKIKSLPVYFVRRYCRVGIPLVVMIVLSNSPLLKMDMSLFGDSILWSLAAELIYYGIYPLILKLHRKCNISWKNIILVSFIAAMLVASSYPSAGAYLAFGVKLNWLLGLPCWLLGVQLAEKVSSDNEPEPEHIWFWRMSVWAASVVCSILRFHSPLGYPWTLDFFAILVYFWLLQEIRFYKYNTPPKILEWGGKWSYSLYLIHILAQQVWLMLPDINLGYFLNWLSKMLFLLTYSYTFAIIIEFPSHRFSKFLAQYLTSKKNTSTT